SFLIQHSSLIFRTQLVLCLPGRLMSGMDELGRPGGVMAKRSLEPINSKKMAKEITGFVKLQCKGGQANPAPPIGPALGSKGINIMEFCKQFNARTQD